MFFNKFYLKNIQSNHFIHDELLELLDDRLEALEDELLLLLEFEDMLELLLDHDGSHS